MSLISGEGPNAARFSVCCDVCRTRGVGTKEELTAAGWHLESLTMTPHMCSRCAAVEAEHLRGHRVHSRQPDPGIRELPSAC